MLNKRNEYGSELSEDGKIVTNENLQKYTFTGKLTFKFVNGG